MKLDFVELRASDWRRSLDWWRGTLGLPTVLVDEEGGFALLDAGGARLALKQGTPAPGGVLLALRVDGLDAWASRLGCAIEESREGYRRAKLRDPDGYAVVLFEQAAQQA